MSVPEVGPCGFDLVQGDGEFASSSTSHPGTELHASLPWTLEVGTVTTEEGEVNPFCTISDSTSRNLAYLTLDPESVVANAELIVRSVNSIPALVKALEAALSVLQAYQTTKIGIHSATIDEIRAALQSYRKQS